jgi:hypothetical protein
MKTILAAALGCIIVSAAYAEPISTVINSTGEWGTWLMEGYDPTSEKQIPLIGPIDTLGECTDAIIKGVKGLPPAQDTWPKLVIYCVPANVVPADGVGVLPKKNR